MHSVNGGFESKIALHRVRGPYTWVSLRVGGIYMGANPVFERLLAIDVSLSVQTV